MQRSLFDETDESMLSVEGFLANKCRVRAAVKDWERSNRQPIGAACGLKCYGLCEQCDPVGFLLRTSVACACEALTGCSMVWSGKDTPAGRWWWVLGQSERPIDANESGSWPTLHGTQGNNGPSGCELGFAMNQWATPRVIMPPEKPETVAARKQKQVEAMKAGGPRYGGMSNLHVQAIGNWPTTRASDGRSKGTSSGDSLPIIVGRVDQESHSTNGSDPDWPTPRTGRLDGGSNSRKTAANKGILKEATTRSLNAEWVAQLMGYPSDWLDLPTEVLSALWETRSSRK